MVALPAADTRNFGLQGACMGLNSPALTACGSRRDFALVCLPVQPVPPVQSLCYYMMLNINIEFRTVKNKKIVFIFFYLN